jgi:hypothetical protein
VPYREVKVYDGEFPTTDQIMSGDPGAPPTPKEVWLQQVKSGEFAVRYKDFKSGQGRDPQGKHVKGSEICRIFDNLAEARANSRQVTQEYWTIGCFIYDHTGSQIESIFNKSQVNKFAMRMYAAILFWTACFAVAGMALIWGVYRVALAFLAPKSEPLHSLTWLGWCAFAAAGLAVGILGWLASLRFKAGARIKKVRASFTPEEMKRFEELNTLHGTADPAERQRFLALMKEYQQRVREALKK